MVTFQDADTFNFNFYAYTFQIYTRLLKVSLTLIIIIHAGYLIVLLCTLCI